MGKVQKAAEEMSYSWHRYEDTKTGGDNRKSKAERTTKTKKQVQTEQPEESSEQ